VPKVESFVIDGLRLWWWPNDHEPPHFHAERPGEWEVRVLFLSDQIETKWGRPRGSRLKALRAQTANHRAELLLEWERKVIS